MSEETARHQKSSLVPTWFWIIAVILTVVWLLGPKIVNLMGGSVPPANAGEFGDQYGVINTLFSGLAFLGVLAGILIQGKEFRNQLLEMSNSSNEMKLQTGTFEKQLALLEKQNELLKTQIIGVQIQERMAALPFLVVSSSSSKSNSRFVIKNRGATVYSLIITSDLEPTQKFVLAFLDQNSAEHSFDFDFDVKDHRSTSKLEVSYTTRLGLSYTEFFSLRFPDDYSMFAYSDIAKLGSKIRDDLKIGV